MTRVGLSQTAETSLRRSREAHKLGRAEEIERRMHTKLMMIVGVVVCIFAMLAYLFVFADAPIADLQPPQGNPTAQ
jgi:hypothetical protein